MEAENNTKITLHLDRPVAIGRSTWEKGEYQSHYHDHFEMEIVIGGRGRQIFNGKEMKLEEKDVFLTRPLDFHKIFSDDISFLTLDVKPEYVPKWIIARLHSLKNPFVVHLNDAQYSDFVSLIDMLSREIEGSHNEEDNPLNIVPNFVSLIFLKFLKLSKNNIYEDDDLVNKVIYYLQENNRFLGKVDLKEIANAIGYSKYYTSARFHKKYGTSIQYFIISLRIEYAKKLILESKLSITDIILECGFPSTSNFYSAFTKLVGCTPLQFRKKNTYIL